MSTAPDPFARHRAEVAATLPGGGADPAAVKRLYVHLGEDLAAAYRDDPLSAPRLSYPETAAVVAAQVPPTARLVLDAGCGPDPGVGLLLCERATVVAVDIGHGTVALAVAGAAARGHRLLGVVADVEALPFRDGAFDAVVCDDTVEHLPDDRQGLRELGRVVGPGGRVVVATPNRWSAQVITRRVRDLRKGRRHARSHYFAAESHLREYTWPGLVRLARSAGLRVTACRSVDWPGGGRMAVASRLTRRWPGRLLGRVLVLVLER